jgi:hypothetical protein
VAYEARLYKLIETTSRGCTIKLFSAVVG